MYNSQGVYSITGDMCYENKIMQNAVTPEDLTATKLNIEEHRSEPKRNSPRLGRRKFKFRFAYVVNTVVAIIVTVVCAIIEFGVVPAQKTGFYCRDPSLSHKYRGDTISTTVLLLVSSLMPLFLFVFVESQCRGRRRSVRDARVVWKWYLDLVIGLFVTLTVTEVCKLVAGEPRPHFLDTCLPDANADCTPGTYITSYECTNKNASAYLLTDSLRSFPSGHSSVAMMASLYCAAYIHARIRTLKFGMLMKPFLLTLVLCWGPASGLSRIVDHRHHWWDVLLGLVLGIAGAIYTVKMLSSNFVIKSPMENQLTAESTATLFDETNKGATSVMI